MLDENWKKDTNDFLRDYVGTKGRNVSHRIAEAFVSARFEANELKRFWGNVTVSILTIVIEYAGILRREYQDMSLCDCENLLNFISNIAEYPNDEALKRFTDLYEIVLKKNEGNPDEREVLKECYRSVSAASMATFFDFKFYLAHAGMVFVTDKRITYSREEQVNLIEQGWIHGGLMYVVNNGTGVVKECGHDFVLGDDMGEMKHVLIWQPAVDRETANINYRLFVPSGPFFQMAPITIVENAGLNVVQRYVDALSDDENVVCVPFLNDFSARITNLFKVNYIVCNGECEEEPHITPVMNKEL